MSWCSAASRGRTFQFFRVLQFRSTVFCYLQRMLVHASNSLVIFQIEIMHASSWSMHNRLILNSYLTYTAMVCSIIAALREPPYTLIRTKRSTFLAECFAMTWRQHPTLSPLENYGHTPRLSIPSNSHVFSSTRRI